MSLVQIDMSKLEGACNLRDLGGHPTQDGRKVRRGQIFRSGVLTYLTPADKDILAGLGLKTIIDLRRSDEILAEPTHWPTPVRMLSWLEDAELGRVQRTANWEKAETGAEAQAQMIKAYLGMSEWLVQQLSGIFETILSGEIPLLFHCAAGKDRTGFCSAILLRTLGVPRQAVLEEFELTNTMVDLGHFMQKHRNARLGISDVSNPFEVMPAEVAQALLKADQLYLAAALDELEQRHGSVEAYVAATLSIDKAAQQTIRDRLLES